MECRDALGRRRRASQNRGLRPLYPRLAPGMESRSIRVAMAGTAWKALDRELATSRSPTRPRAIGEVLERGLAHEDWQQWQIRKERQLLARVRPKAS